MVGGSKIFAGASPTTPLTVVGAGRRRGALKPCAMALSLGESRACTEMAKLLYEFLPGSRVEAVEPSLRGGSSISEAASAVGAHRDTPHKLMKRDPKFAAKVELVGLSPIRTLVNALGKKAKSCNVTAAIFFLCNRDREWWQHVNRIEFTGKNGGPIRYDDAIRRIDERRAELLGGASVVRDGAGGNGA